jgi:crotonobetainyl-CoA:carnitine CoA-transferase CaiB-like acyl-CoA transferase
VPRSVLGGPPELRRVSGVLSGIEVLDLTRGVGGSVATMLLGDHGARVTRIEPPGGSPIRQLSGARVWCRSKRSAFLDLDEPRDRARLRALAATADVLVEDLPSGGADRIGLDAEWRHAHNPGLVHCSITAYGRGTRDEHRPAIEALVAARTGQQWESRGVVGGTIARLAGVAPSVPDVEVPNGVAAGPPRPGPLFAGVPWVGMAVAYHATLVVSAALRVRARTGRGQRVHTSMLQGVLGTTQFAWQRVDHPDAPSYQSWIIDSRAPRGVYRCADGRWVHQWVPLPDFILPPSAGDQLVRTPHTKRPREAAARIGVEIEEIPVLLHYDPLFAEAFARFPSDEWVALAADVGVPLQPLRSPEEALHDPLLLADGCVIEVDDPDLGPVRQVGRVYDLHACPTDPPTPPVAPGSDTEAVVAEADALLAAPARPARRVGAAATGAPLAGVRVIDLGVAVAGPWGTMMLADLGADVIKVNQHSDAYWMRSHIAMGCNRGKRSIVLDLKRPEAMELLLELVRSADIVQHNMRYDAAERLGVDYERLRTVNPSLIYCHTRGFERGPRVGLPGNDQTGAALAGPDWLDGGLDHDGYPSWPAISLGDTGNGYLSAIAMVQALYHRDRTGEGQFVDTSIIYAHLLNASIAWDTPQGRGAPARPSLDRMALGWSPWYRLYDTADGWLCIAAIEPAHRRALLAALAVDRAEDDIAFSALEPAFTNRAAREWVEILDGAGVPAEVSDPDFALGLFDDPEMIERGWVVAHEHPVVGRMDTLGLLFDLDETPGTVRGPAFVPGQHTREILRDVGRDDAAIDELVAAGIVGEWVSERPR